jgi:hypothetical protein
MTTCAVSWCVALVTPERVAKGWTHCEVHRKGPHGPKLHPQSLGPGEDVQASVECEECKGEGDCCECDGSGEHECDHAGCYDTHDCHICRGSGKCAECKGQGSKTNPINAYLRWAFNLDAPKPLPDIVWPWDDEATA